MARSDLHWWIENITDASNTVMHGNCQVIVYSDASLTGWGGVFNSITTGGQWTEDESQNHINYLGMFSYLEGILFPNQELPCEDYD